MWVLCLVLEKKLIFPLARPRTFLARMPFHCPISIFVSKIERGLLCFASPPSLAEPYLSHTAMSASKPSPFLLFLFSIRTSAHRHPHRQLDNGPAAPVYANAGPANGPPITPTKPFNNGANFRIGGPPEIRARTADQPEIALTQNPAYEARNF